MYESLPRDQPDRCLLQAEAQPVDIVNVEWLLAELFCLGSLVLGGWHVVLEGSILCHTHISLSRRRRDLDAP